MKFGPVLQPVCGEEESGSMKLCLILKFTRRGMVILRAKLTAGLNALGVEPRPISQTGLRHPARHRRTRDLPGLWRAHRRGVRIVQRFERDELIHRIHHTGWKHSLRAEYTAIHPGIIRSRWRSLSSTRSEFARAGGRIYGSHKSPSSVIIMGWT